MATVKPGILILSPFFSPNIGGVETHLDDLVAGLQNFSVFVFSYSPITTPNVRYQIFEKRGNLQIVRLPHFGKNLFHQLEKYSILDFLYLTPYLLIFSFLWMLFNSSKVKTIHSHGFNAAFIGNLLATFFRKKHVTSTHAVYEHIHGLSLKLVVATLSAVDHILCLSQASQKQLLSWGLSPAKTSLYQYWINLNNFVPVTTPPKKFTVLYVGRLITKKGIRLILQSAINIRSAQFNFIGTGPAEETIRRFSKKYKNINFTGPIPNSYLPQYYQQASILCLPSLYPEGYGRVVMEAVASGLPVIASNTAGLKEALSSKVAILIKPTVKNLTLAIKKLQHKQTYNHLRRNCRHYALAKFSSSNIKSITRFY